MKEQAWTYEQARRTRAFRQWSLRNSTRPKRLLLDISPDSERYTVGKCDEWIAEAVSYGCFTGLEAGISDFTFDVHIRTAFQGFDHFFVHFLVHFFCSLRFYDGADVQEVCSIGLKWQYTCTRSNLSSRTTSLSTSTHVASVCLVDWFSSLPQPGRHLSGRQLGIDRYCLSIQQRLCVHTRDRVNRHRDSKIIQAEEDISEVSLPLFDNASKMQEMQCQCGNGRIAFLSGCALLSTLVWTPCTFKVTRIHITCHIQNVNGLKSIDLQTSTCHAAKCQWTQIQWHKISSGRVALPYPRISCCLSPEENGDGWREI